MIVPEYPRTPREQCAALVARLGMLAADQDSTALSPDFTGQLGELTSAIVAQAEIAGQTVTASMTDRRRAAEVTRFLSARLTRMATAAQDVMGAAERGDMGALRRQLRRFEVLETAMWTVQAALRPPHPADRPARPAVRRAVLTMASPRDAPLRTVPGH